MKFCRLDECLKINDMLSILTEKNSVYFEDCFKIYHIYFNSFMYILHVSNLLKKEFTKHVLDSTSKIGREKIAFRKIMILFYLIIQILLYLIPKIFVLAVSLNY